MSSKLVYYYNLNVGSGIENVGNIVKTMLYAKGCEIYEYKFQTKSELMLDDLNIMNPDVIVMNELYPRVAVAIYRYKKDNPDVKVILINHVLSTLRCYPFDTENPFSYDIENIDELKKFIEETVDKIINIDWNPHDLTVPSILDGKVVHIMIPIDEQFINYTPWIEREDPLLNLSGIDAHDFMYLGNVLPHKFSPELIQKLSTTDLIINVFGNVMGDEEYQELVNNCPNLVLHGYVDEDKLVHEYNRYRFFISSRTKGEPNHMAMAEAILCGCIPLVHNDRSQPWSNWIDHYYGCYKEFQTVDSLLDFMQYYVDNREDMELMSRYNSWSKHNAIELKRRINLDGLKEMIVTDVRGYWTKTSN